MIGASSMVHYVYLEWRVTIFTLIAYQNIMRTVTKTFSYIIINKEEIFIFSSFTEEN